MKFFERFLNQEFNLNEEICNIDYLFNHDQSFDTPIVSTIKARFLQWPLRKTCVKYSDFAEKSKLNDIVEKAQKNIEVTIDEYLDVVEIVMSLLQYFYNDVKDKKSYRPLIDNILNVTEALNFDIKFVNTLNHAQYAIFIPKDIKVLEAAEIVEDDNLSEKIYLYRHRKLNGNIYEKAIILSRLYMYFEGIRKTLEQNNFGSLCTSIGELSDKLKVRHKPKGYEELVVEELSKEELEEAYDKLFDSYLAAIVISQYINDRDYLEILRKKFVKQ